MATLPTWINQSPTNLDVVTPIKARAYNALQAVLKGRQRHADHVVTLMRRGDERC